jgi:hypothetical protein
VPFLTRSVTSEVTIVEIREKVMKLQEMLKEGGEVKYEILMHAS